MTIHWFRFREHVILSPRTKRWCLWRLSSVKSGLSSPQTSRTSACRWCGCSRTFSRAAVVFCGRCFRFDWSRCFFSSARFLARGVVPHCRWPPTRASYTGCSFSHDRQSWKRIFRLGTELYVYVCVSDRVVLA